MQSSGLTTPGPACEGEKGRGVTPGPVWALVSLRVCMGAPFHLVLSGTLSCSLEVLTGWRSEGSGELRPFPHCSPRPLPCLFPLSGSVRLQPTHMHMCVCKHTCAHTQAHAHTHLAPLSLRLHPGLTSFLSVPPLNFPPLPRESHSTFIGLLQSRCPRKVQRVHAKMVLATGS